MTTPQFSRTWAENTTIQEWIDTQYKAGWATVGDTPPTVQQFDAVLNELDRKAQYLYQVQTGYLSTKKYRAGEICFAPDNDNVPVVGNYYECYRPEGCVGKDPREATNRPDGWTNTDASAPYFWIKLGKWLELPAIGTPVGLFKTALPQGYLKLNGTTVNASKFWRLAQTYPDLVTGSNISLPDLRAEFIRGLDDGRGVDTGRVVGSVQGDAIRNITGRGSVNGGSSVASLNWYKTTGVFGKEQEEGVNASTNTGNYNPSPQNCARLVFDASRVVPTAAENRPRNIALLYVTRF